MGAIVGIDALVLIKAEGETKFTVLPERNEFSISINVDVAEHKVFVASLADAWVDKKRTWMNWSGSLNGYYSDADDSIYKTVMKGQVVTMRFYDTREGAELDETTGAPLDTEVGEYWEGNVLLTSVEHGTGTDDFSTLNVNFEGLGKLKRFSGGSEVTV